MDTDGPSTGSDPAAPEKKSNADFKAMLLGGKNAQE
jgi:hypothetical protein